MNKSSPITELAVAMDHSQSRMSHTVAALVGGDLVRREPDPDDRRFVRAVLTPTGRGA